MLSKLRAELHISDDRHLQLRQCVVDGDEQPWLRCALWVSMSPARLILVSNRMHAPCHVFALNVGDGQPWLQCAPTISHSVPMRTTQ